MEQFKPKQEMISEESDAGMKKSKEVQRREGSEDAVRSLEKTLGAFPLPEIKEATPKKESREGWASRRRRQGEGKMI